MANSSTRKRGARTGAYKPGRPAYKRKAKKLEVNTRFSSNLMPRFNVGTSMPTRKVITLPWVGLTNTSTSTAGGLIANTSSFRLNSMYDPTVAIGGQQPRGLDQWAGFYTRAKVTSAQVKITAFPISAAWGDLQGAFLAFGVRNSADATNSVNGLDYSAVVEKSQTGAFLIDGFNKQGNQVMFTVNMAQVEGRSLADDNYTHPFNSGNPGNIIHLDVGAGSAAGKENIAISYVVEIIYTAVLYERNQLPTSI